MTVCTNRELKGASITATPGGRFVAPAVLYFDPDGRITDRPNGKPVVFLNEQRGDVLTAGPIYRAPCGGLTDEGNGRPLFDLWSNNFFNDDGSIKCAGDFYCNAPIPCAS